MADNPHFLEKDIHVEFNSGILATGFDERITGLANDFPTGTARFLHAYENIIREHERKLRQSNLKQLIKGTGEAGSKTYPVSDFFSKATSPLTVFYPGASAAYSLRDLKANDGSTTVVEVRRSSDQEEQSFTAAQIASGEMLNWVTAEDSNADGFVVTWYDQSGNSYDAREPAAQYQPKIVENGSLVTDNDGKIAIKGTGSKLRLGHFSWRGESPREMLSSDGTHSLFIVCDLPNQTAGNRDYNFIFRFYSTSLSPKNRRPQVYLIRADGNLKCAAEATPSKVSVNSSDAQTAQLITDIVNPSGTTKAEKHSVYVDGTFNSEQPYGTNWTSDGNTTLHQNAVLFARGETTVDTYISEVIYYPSDQSANRPAIEANILNHYDI